MLRLSLFAAFAGLALTLPFLQQPATAQQFQNSLPPWYLFRNAQTADTIFRGQSPDSGLVPAPMDAGEWSLGTAESAYAGYPAHGMSAGHAAHGMSDCCGGTTPDFVMSRTAAYPMMADAGCCGAETALAMDDGTTTWNAFSPQFAPDPFMNQPGYGMPPAYGAPPGYGMPPGYGGQPGYGMPPSPYAPYSPYGGMQSVPPQGFSTFGAQGARPFRYGWSNAVDVSWMPETGVSGPPAGASGKMGIFGVDYRLSHQAPVVPGWILNWTNQFGYRNWERPSGGISLPSDVFRFGMDFELKTAQQSPLNFVLGINPSFNTDFDASGSKGFQLDGRGIMLMQLDPYWTLGLGAMYWDRVDDIVIPWAGLIYRDDYWEWQLMFPEARVSLFLGNEAMWSKWLYVRGEYHVESYGVNRGFGGVTADDEIQLSDYRILLGMKMDSGYFNWFFEGGWVLDRSVEFRNSTVPGFSLSDGFIGQIGLRY